MTDKALIAGADGAMTGFRHDVLIATTGQIEGRRVQRVVGLVRGNTIRARHLGWDISAALRNLVGGEITAYTKLLAESREQAIDRMVEQAASLGANAVLEVRFTTSVVMGGASELLAYGTGVVLADED